MKNGKIYTREFIEKELGERIRNTIRECNCEDCRDVPMYKLPSWEWLNDHGYSGLHKAVSREFDGKTTHEVLSMYCGFEDPSADWPGNHGTTHSWIEKYLNHLSERRNLEESTIGSRRTHLRKHLEFIYQTGGTVDLLRYGHNEIEGFQVISQAFKLIDRSLASEPVKRSYADTLVDFYEYLSRRSKVDSNPADEALDEYGWKYGSKEGKPKPLSINQVQRAWAAAETLKEQCLLVLFFVIGARTKDTARLRITDVVLDESDPRVDFDPMRSKEGETMPLISPGAIQTMQNWITLVQDQNEENGCLFPSPSSDSGHRTATTLTNWFKRIMNRADITVDDETPTPGNGRDFRHELCRDAVERWMNQQRVTTDMMDKENPQVTDRHYSPDSEMRAYIRRQKRRVFSRAMPVEEVIDPTEEESDENDISTDLDDFVD
jgi:site-specific recombinase XerD